MKEIDETEKKEGMEERKFELQGEKSRKEKCSLPCLPALQAGGCVHWNFHLSIRTKHYPCPHKPQSFLYERCHIPHPERRPRHNTGWVSASSLPQCFRERKCFWKGSSLTAAYYRPWPSRWRQSGRLNTGDIGPQQDFTAKWRQRGGDWMNG